jgi:hypothetical protein
VKLAFVAPAAFPRSSVNSLRLLDASQTQLRVAPLRSEEVIFPIASYVKVETLPSAEVIDDGFRSTEVVEFGS